MSLTYRQPDNEGDDFPDSLPDPSDAERAIFDGPLIRPLAVYDTADIMGELEMRFPAFVFHASQRQKDDSTGAYYHGHGDYYACVGLAHALIQKLDDC